MKYACILVMFASPSLFAQAKKEPPTVALKMEDQFERKQELKAYQGDVVVLLFGDRKATDANSALGERLHVQFHPTAKGQPIEKARKAPVAPLEGVPQGTRSPEVHVIPVACIGKVPGAVRALLRNQFASASPVIPVWMDFQDDMKTTFGIEDGVPNVVVLDARNRLRFKLTGELDAKNYERLVQVVDFLRKEAVSK